MQTVWKETLDWKTAEPQLKMLPGDAEILHVGEQDGRLTFWFLTDPRSKPPLVGRTFYIVGTGHEEVRPGSKYLHTLFRGWLVLHLFEMPYEEDRPASLHAGTL